MDFSRWVLRIPEHVSYTVLDGEAILLDSRQGRYLAVDEIGTRIWQLLEEDGRVERLLAKLLEEYEVEKTALCRDLEALLGQCLELGLMEKEDDLQLGEEVDR